MVLALIAESSISASSGNFFAYSGVAAALIFANVGAAYGTAKSAIGIGNLGAVD
tara:strand:- start:436 stop:597 length:162 start_codon:yes stop_codon:yes gene_type:complete